MSKSEETPDSNVGNISMHDFLDFLKISCQLNESISGNSQKSNKKIDYDQLTKNELIQTILSKSNCTNRLIVSSEKCSGESHGNSLEKKGLR